MSEKIECAKHLIAESVERIEDGRPGDAAWRLIEATADLLEDDAAKYGMDAAKHSLDKVLIPVMVNAQLEQTGTAGTVEAFVRLADDMKRIADTIEQTRDFHYQAWFKGHANAFYLCAAAIRDLREGKEPWLPDYGQPKHPKAQNHSCGVDLAQHGADRTAIHHSDGTVEIRKAGTP